MDPVTIAAAIGAVANFLLSISMVDSVGGAISGAIRNAKYKKTYDNLAKKISQDEELFTKLLDAANRKDVALGQDLINRSPFGTAFNKLKIRNAQNLKDKEQIEQALTEVKTKGNAALSQASTNPTASGSLTSDLINAGSHVEPEYTTPKISNSIKERLK